MSYRSAVLKLAILACMVGGPATAQDIRGSHLRYRVVSESGEETDVLNVLKNGRIIILLGKPCAGQTKDRKTGDEAWLGRRHSYRLNCGGSQFQSETSASFVNGILAIDRSTRSKYGLYSEKLSIQVNGRECSGEIVRHFNGRPQGISRIVGCKVGAGVAQ